MPRCKPNFNGYGGIDYTLYMDATRRWLAGGSFFEPYQLAGPYPLQMGDVLYRADALPLFVAVHRPAGGPLVGRSRWASRPG